MGVVAGCGNLHCVESAYSAWDRKPLMIALLRLPPKTAQLAGASQLAVVRGIVDDEALLLPDQFL